MSIRSRTWATADGKKKKAWVVDYFANGGRHLKTFPKKSDAEDWAASTKVEIKAGTHTPHSNSITVQQAGDHWIASAKAANLERTTTESYEQILRDHICPALGTKRLSELTAPMARNFEDGLKGAPGLRKKIKTCLGSLLADAQERGYVNRNVVRELTSKRRKRSNGERHKKKLQVGVDIPTPSEIKAIIAALNRYRPLLLTAIFTGLRASELRGLRWADVDFKKAEIRVRQRADRHKEMGRPKSPAGERTVPMPPLLVRTLREWKLKCPNGNLDLVFPTGKGDIEHHKNIVRHGLWPAQIAAGVCELVKDADGKMKMDKHGKPVLRAKYQGLHALRHFFASWCINRKVDGGLELPAKVVQERLGHASIVMTLDTYGHLFPRGDDAAELAAAETALLG